MNRPLNIGLTGGIGAGKSLVLKFLAAHGIPVLQTDVLAHQLLENRKLKRSLVRHFGKTILGLRGKIDRNKLAAEAFQNRDKQEKLNQLIHPAILKGVAQWLQGNQKKGSPLLVVEVPLLFERGFYRSFDGVLCVSAPQAVRRKRLLQRGWSKDEIKRREKLQWSQTRKNQKSNWVIYNQSTQKALKYAVDLWLEKFLEDRQILFP
jgi:dephospho-CoA kinase